MKLPLMLKTLFKEFFRTDTGDFINYLIQLFPWGVSLTLKILKDNSYRQKPEIHHDEVSHKIQTSKLYVTIPVFGFPEHIKLYVTINNYTLRFPYLDLLSIFSSKLSVIHLISNTGKTSVVSTGINTSLNFEIINCRL